MDTMDFYLGQEKVTSVVTSSDEKVSEKESSLEPPVEEKSKLFLTLNAPEGAVNGAWFATPLSLSSTTVEMIARFAHSLAALIDKAEWENAPEWVKEKVGFSEVVHESWMKVPQEVVDEWNKLLQEKNPLLIAVGALALWAHGLPALKKKEESSWIETAESQLDTMQESGMPTDADWEKLSLQLASLNTAMKVFSDIGDKAKKSLSDVDIWKYGSSSMTGMIAKKFGVAD